MLTSTTMRSKSAIAIGLFFAGVAGWILLWDVRSLADLNVDHVQVVASLLGSIAAGHFVVVAYRQRLYIWAAMLAIAFCVGTITCAITSAGRGAEVAQKRQAEASRLNAMRADTAAELAKARASHKEMTDRYTVECASGRGTRCSGMKSAIDYVDSHLAILQVRMDGMQAEQVGNAKTAHAARMLSFFLGFNQAKAEEGLSLLLPFTLPLITELLSIAFLGLGFGHRTQQPFPFASTRKPIEIMPPRAKPTDLDIVRDALMKAGRPVSNDELADLMGVSKSEASKRVAALGAHLRKQRHGKFSAITLA